MPRVIYFPQPDDRPTPPTALPIDESSDGWWAGAFVAVPLAGAAAALALTASLAFGYQQQADDIVPQPTVALEEGYGPVSTPPPLAPVFLYLPDPEEIPAGVLFGPPDQTYWWPPPEARSASASIQPPWWDDQALPPTAPAVALEDDSWQATAPALLPPRALYLPDPELLPAGFLFGVPDDQAWSQAWVVRPALVVPLWAVEDELPSVSAPADDGSGWTLAGGIWVPSPSARPLLLWLGDDDAPSQPLRISEDYWWTAYSLPAVLVASAWLVDVEPFTPPLFIPIEFVRLVDARGVSPTLTQARGQTAGLEAVMAIIAELLNPKGKT